MKAGPVQAANEPETPERYAVICSWAEQLAASLTDEDQCVHSMRDAGPAKWYQADTFEQLVLSHGVRPARDI